MTFTLTGTTKSGKSAYSTVKVIVNSPPSPGIFYADPRQGFELSDMFTLAASKWIDDDLPLTYAFGFYEGITAQIVQARSPSSFAYTKLGAGKDNNNYEVVILSMIYDIYSAYIDTTLSENN